MDGYIFKKNISITIKIGKSKKVFKVHPHANYFPNRNLKKKSPNLFSIQVWKSNSYGSRQLQFRAFKKTLLGFFFREKTFLYAFVILMFLK